MVLKANFQLNFTIAKGYKLEFLTWLVNFHLCKSIYNKDTFSISLDNLTL